MQDVVDGKQIQPVRLRNRDFCQDLAQNFNIILERVQQSDRLNHDGLELKSYPEEAEVSAV